LGVDVCSALGLYDHLMSDTTSYHGPSGL